MSRQTRILAAALLALAFAAAAAALPQPQTDNGPIMLVKLAAGKYAVTAMKDGETLHRTVQVKAQGDRQLVFHWPKA